jgi:hypothetical protein
MKVELGQIAITGQSEYGELMVDATFTRDVPPGEEVQTAFFKQVGSKGYFVYGMPHNLGGSGLFGIVPGIAIGGGAGDSVVRVIAHDDSVLAEGSFRIEGHPPDEER